MAAFVLSMWLGDACRVLQAARLTSFACSRVEDSKVASTPDTPRCTLLTALVWCDWDRSVNHLIGGRFVSIASRTLPKRFIPLLPRTLPFTVTKYCSIMSRRVVVKAVQNMAVDCSSSLDATFFEPTVAESQLAHATRKRDDTRLSHAKVCLLHVKAGVVGRKLQLLFNASTHSHHISKLYLHSGRLRSSAVNSSSQRINHKSE